MGRKRKGAARSPARQDDKSHDDADWVLVGDTHPGSKPSTSAVTKPAQQSIESLGDVDDATVGKKQKKNRAQTKNNAGAPAAVPEKSASETPLEELDAASMQQPNKKRKRRRGGNGGHLGFLGSKKFLTVFLLGALTALCVWLYIDLIIIAEEASKFRPLTEKAVHVVEEAHHRAAEVALKAQRKAAQAAEELQHSLDDISAYMENMLFANKTTLDPTRPGLSAREEMSPHFPVLMVPGVVSTGLEIWNGRPCALKHFRMRIWGTVTMMQKLLLDKQCWLDHVMLDKETGLDPEGIKLRAASGLEAADYLFPGYWVWGKLIQNFADIGYDSNNLFMAAYDWRLSFKGLQQRDSYFTKLKHMIELAYDTNHNRKVVVLTHSMGSNVFLYFLNWVQADPATNDGDGGGASAAWVDKYIESWVNIAGPMLGVPKALASLSSGEMRDTAQLGALESYAMENFFSRRQRAEMLRSWGSIASMLPKGGDPIWGNATFAPDGVLVKGHMISFRPEEREETLEDEAVRAELDLADDGADEVDVEETDVDTVEPTVEETEITKAEETKAADAEVQPTGGSFLLPGADAASLGPVDTANATEVAADAVTASAEAVVAEEDKRAMTQEEDTRDAFQRMKSSLKRHFGSSESSKKKKKKRSHKKHKAPTPPPHALVRNVTMGEAIDWMIAVASDPHFERYIRSVYSYGVETDGRKLVGPRAPKYWSNPLESALPDAPNMKIYCLYGVGKGAERAYVYRHTDLADELQQTVKEQDLGRGFTSEEADLDGAADVSETVRRGKKVKAGEAGGEEIEDEEHDVPFRIDNEVSDPEYDLVSGVQDSPGDGTVPLMSLGYMCVEGWRRPDYPYNPANMPVVTREYAHQPTSVFTDLRGGPGTADHVDIMGNYEMTIDILRVAANQGHKLEERIVSPILDFARRVDLRYAPSQQEPPQ